jgi:hypothetical protein
MVQAGNGEGQRVKDNGMARVSAKVRDSPRYIQRLRAWMELN